MFWFQFEAGLLYNGYEPAGLTIHSPPPPKQKGTIKGGFIFFRMGV